MNRSRLILTFMFIMIPPQLFGLYFHYTPYSGSMQEIKTEHFIVAFPKGYESVGRKVAAYAEEAHQLLSDFFQWESYQRTTLILSPETDSANGKSMPAFRNVIVLYLAQFELESSLDEIADPLWTTIVHEYTHVLHIDQLRGAGWFWRVLFGKLYFPNSATFNWNVEGMATLTESIFSDTGRLRSAYNEALIADAARHHAIPEYCKLIPPYRVFPYGHAVYHFGARFLEYLYTAYGREKFQSFFIDLSYDFLPFVPMFVITFRKVYGKSLSELWSEWIAAEEARYCTDGPHLQNGITNSGDGQTSVGSDFAGDGDIQNDTVCDDTVRQLTNNRSNITAFDIADDGSILYAANGAASDSYIYRVSNGKSSKYRYGSVRDICIDGDKVYWTQNLNRNDNKTFYDLFVSDAVGKRRRRLTKTGHISYVAAHNGTVFAVRHSFDSAEICALPDGVSLRIPGIRYIDRISFSPDGRHLAFAGKLASGQRNIYIWDLSDDISASDGDKVCHYRTVLTEVNASSAEWIDNERLSFIMSFDRHNAVCLLDTATGEVRSLLNRDDVYPYLAKVRGNKLYFAGYTYRGEEIFEADLPSDLSSGTIIQKSDYVQRNSFFDRYSDGSRFNRYGVHNYEPERTAAYKVTTFHFWRYLLPAVWGIVPTTLDSSAYFTESVSLPFIAPKLMLLNESPTGRLSYTASVTYDYIKQYPNNDLNITFMLPCTNISLSWSNWLGGTVIWYKDKFIMPNKQDSSQSRYPICFRDSLSVNSRFTLCGYDFLSFGVSAVHQYSQWASYTDYTAKQTVCRFNKNQIYWLENIMYQFVVNTAGASRWNRGFYINLLLYQAPQMLDNNALYIADIDMQFRMPVSQKIFQFTSLQSGFELCDYHNARNVYRVDSALYNILGNKIDAVGNTSINTVDGKAFSTRFNDGQYSKGFGYISLNAGFDLTVWNKPHYWHFATLGFKEFFIRLYNQYIYLFAMQPTIENFFVDVVTEFVVDLTAGYGNLGAQFAFGAAIGYQGGRDRPSWGINFNVAFGIGY